jgi:hypothetical protein
MAITVIAAHAQAQEPPVMLSVKPELCITTQREQDCETSFLVQWESEHIGHYCLNDEFSAKPLRCWEQMSSGRFDEERVVTRSFIYRLMMPGRDQPIAEVKVELMTLDSPDRRRRRRSRHAWSIM